MSIDEAQFGTVYGQISANQQLPGTPPPVANPFLARGTYQLELAGGQQFLRGEMLPPEGPDSILYGAVWAATRMMADMQRRQQGWNVSFVAMKTTIGTLAHEVAELKCEIQRLHKSRVYVVPLTTLSPSRFEMIQQIPVTIEGDGEDFTATFVEANVSAAGETEADAIANFKDSLLSSYEVLEGVPTSQLGPLPTRQLGILRSVVRRTD